jgi:hypothetical protein
MATLERLLQITLIDGSALLNSDAKKFEILVRFVPGTKSVVYESCVETDAAFELLDDVSLSANRMDDCVHHCKGGLHCCANDLIEYTGANLRTRDVAVCQDEVSKDKTIVSQIVLEVTFCFHELFQ